MTAAPHMADDIAAAIMHRIAGDGPATAAAIDRCMTNPRDAFLTAYTLAHYVAERVPGAGPVVVDIEDVAPGHEDIATVVAALIAAAGNRDGDGAARAFYAADAKSAAGAIVDLLDACAGAAAQGADR